MADHIYEAGGQTSTAAAAGPIINIIAATTASGIRVPEIREMGFTLISAVACDITVGQPATAGTAGNNGTPTAPVTVNAVNHIDPTGHTIVGFSTWSSTPTAPTAVVRRVSLPATIGAGIIWVWNPGEFQLYPTGGPPGSFLTVWQASTSAVILDWYVKVAE